MIIIFDLIISIHPTTNLLHFFEKLFLFLDKLYKIFIIPLIHLI